MTRVLLVDDSEDVVYLLQLQLEWMGYAVDTATNAEAGLHIAQRVRPDIIVSDLGMPEIDGLEFMRRIRRVRTLDSVPAIALTGASMESDIRQAMANGFNAHLTKPVEASDLAKMIEQLTARRFQRKAG